MSGRYRGVAFVAPEEDRRCEMCGKVTECRPYGPNGEQVCHPCGMKDPENAKRRMNKYIFGEESA